MTGHYEPDVPQQGISGSDVASGDHDNNQLPLYHQSAVESSAMNQPALPCMQEILRELEDAKKTIRTLALELQAVKKELATVKKDCASLHQHQDIIDSSIRDSELKTKNSFVAVEKCFSAAEQTNEATITKLSQEHQVLSKQVNKLSRVKDSEAATLRDLKREIETLSELLSSQVTTPKPATPTPTSVNTAQPSVSQKTHPAVNTQTPQQRSDSVTNIPVSNRFAVLSPGGDEDKSAEHKTENKAVTTAATKKHTPYDLLCKLKVQPQSQALLLGDSVLKRVCDRRMSHRNMIVQNMSVSGLNVADLTKWLQSQRPMPHIRHITYHVGINSCVNGPVTKNEWHKLVADLSRTFPRATLQASLLVPPFGKHHLSEPAYWSNVNLQAVCRNTDVPFVDHSSTFLTARGAPKKALYYDNIHPSNEGTKLLALNLRTGVGHPYNPPSPISDTDNHVPKSGHEDHRPYRPRDQQPLRQRHASSDHMQQRRSKQIFKHAVASPTDRTPVEQSSIDLTQRSSGPARGQWGQQSFAFRSADFPPLGKAGPGTGLSSFASPKSAWGQNKDDSDIDPLKFLMQLMRAAATCQ